MAMLFNNELLEKSDLFVDIENSTFLNHAIETNAIDNIFKCVDSSEDLLDSLECATVKLIQYSNSRIGISHNKIDLNRLVIISGSEIEVDFAGNRNEFFFGESNYDQQYSSSFWKEGSLVKLDIRQINTALNETEMIATKELSDELLIIKNSVNQCVGVQTSFSGSQISSGTIAVPFSTLEGLFYLSTDPIDVSNKMAHNDSFTVSSNEIKSLQPVSGVRISNVKNSFISNLPSKSSVEDTYINRDNPTISNDANISMVKNTNLISYVDAFNHADNTSMLKIGYEPVSPIKTTFKSDIDINNMSQDIMDGKSMNSDINGSSFVARKELELLLSGISEKIKVIEVCA
jgi:hypothetical protein